MIENGHLAEIKIIILSTTFTLMPFKSLPQFGLMLLEIIQIK